MQCAHRRTASSARRPACAHAGAWGPGRGRAHTHTTHTHTHTHRRPRSACRWTAAGAPRARRPSKVHQLSIESIRFSCHGPGTGREKKKKKRKKTRGFTPKIASVGKGAGGERAVGGIAGGRRVEGEGGVGDRGRCPVQRAARRSARRGARCRRFLPRRRRWQPTAGARAALLGVLPAGAAAARHALGHRVAPSAAAARSLVVQWPPGNAGLPSVAAARAACSVQPSELHGAAVPMHLPLQLPLHLREGLRGCPRECWSFLLLLLLGPCCLPQQAPCAARACRSKRRERRGPLSEGPAAAASAVRSLLQAPCSKAVSLSLEIERDCLVGDREGMQQGSLSLSL